MGTDMPGGSHSTGVWCTDMQDRVCMRGGGGTDRRCANGGMVVCRGMCFGRFAVRGKIIANELCRKQLTRAHAHTQSFSFYISLSQTHTPCLSVSLSYSVSVASPNTRTRAHTSHTTTRKHEGADATRSCAPSLAVRLDTTLTHIGTCAYIHTHTQTT